MVKLGLILFDFDRVLFDTGYLLKKLGLYRKRDERVGGFTLRQAQKINWQKIGIENLIYPEVKQVLSYFSHHDWDMAIFSEGEVAGQRFKIKITGLDKIFLKQFQLVYRNKKIALPRLLKELKPRWGQIWIVDDKPEILKIAKKVLPTIKTVLVCRGPWWQVKVSGFAPDFKIKNLNDLRRIIG